MRKFTRKLTHFGDTKMAKSSIKFARTQDNSVAETTRKFEAHYLLEKKYRLKNEYWSCGKSDSQVFQEELAKTKRKGGPKPKEENSLWEAILNLNHEHTMADVQRAVKLVEKKFNIICTRVAIHRDEGHLDKDGKVVYNLHAHLNFVTFKNGRQNWRQKFIRPMMSDLQTEIAKELKMERGRFKEETGVVAMGHREYRAHAKAIEQEQEKVAKKEKELVTEKEKSAYSYRDFQAQITALNSENEELKKELTDTKKELHRLNTSVKKGETDVEELQKRLEEERKKLEAKEKELESVKASLDTQKTLYTSANVRAERATKRIEGLEKKIEELEKELVTEKEKEPTVIEKVVTVEDTKRITELEKEVQELKNEIFDLKLAPPTLTPTPTQKIDSSPVLIALQRENAGLKKEVEALSWYKVQYERIVEKLKKLTGGLNILDSIEIIKAKFLQKQQVQTSLPPKQPLPQERTLPEEKGKEPVVEKESTANAYAELQKQLDKQLDLKNLTSFNEEHKNSSGYTR